MGALLAGVVAGAVWRILAGHTRRTLWFGALWSVCFGLTALLAVAGETQLDHFAAYVLPLGAIVFSLIGLLTGALDRTALVRGKWMPAVAVAIALAIGIGPGGPKETNEARVGASTQVEHLHFAPGLAGEPTGDIEDMKHLNMPQTGVRLR